MVLQNFFMKQILAFDNVIDFPVVMLARKAAALGRLVSVVFAALFGGRSCHLRESSLAAALARQLRLPLTSRLGWRSLLDDVTHDSQDLEAGFIFVRTIFVQKGKCSPFLKLTPSL